MDLVLDELEAEYIADTSVLMDLEGIEVE